MNQKWRRLSIMKVEYVVKSEPGSAKAATNAVPLFDRPCESAAGENASWDIGGRRRIQKIVIYPWLVQMALQLELAFATRSLRNICEFEDVAVEALGPQGAKALQRRLADLRAAVSIDDVLASRKLKVNTKNGELRIPLNANLHISVRPNHTKPVLRPDGGVDWEHVTRIQITEIGDGHD